MTAYEIFKYNGPVEGAGSTMIEKTRRAVLGAIGALTAGTTTAAATGDSECNDCNYGCSRHQTVDCKDVHCGDCQQSSKQETQTVTESKPVGVITIENRTNCTRKVEIQVSGSIADGRQNLPSDETFHSVHVAANNYTERHFIGSIRRLDCEAGDLNIQIQQRSTHDANSDACR